MTTPTAMPALLQASDLHFTISGRSLISGLHLDLEPGKVTTILGPNGAGKSTFLKLLCRQLKPTRGEVTFDGRPLGDWSLREMARRRAVLPQHSSVPFDFTSLEIVLLGRSPYGDGVRHLAMARKAMEWTECAHLADRVARTLSGGELQRVNLARILVQLNLGEDLEPSVLFLDEPVSSQDPAHQHGALQVSREMARRGVAVLVILHDLNLAAQYSDSILILKQGHLIAHGTPSEVLRPELIGSVFDVRATLGVNPITQGPAVFVEPTHDRFG